MYSPCHNSNKITSPESISKSQNILLRFTTFLDSWIGQIQVILEYLHMRYTLHGIIYPKSLGKHTGGWGYTLTSPHGMINHGLIWNCAQHLGHSHLGMRNPVSFNHNRNSVKFRIHFMLRWWRNFAWSISTHCNPKLRDFINVWIISGEKWALPQGKLKLLYIFYLQWKYLDIIMTKLNCVWHGCFHHQNRDFFLPRAYHSQLLPSMNFEFVFLHDEI